jgi:cysteine desulfuration protein SufE
MDLSDLKEHFELLDGWEERYRYLIDLGKRLAPLPDADKNERTKVDGCLSQVWLTARRDGARVRFLADSDAAIVRGLIAVLMLAYDDKTPAEIEALDIGPFFDELGLHQHVSMNRRNGFFAMVGRIRGEARLFATGPELARERQQA